MRRCRERTSTRRQLTKLKEEAAKQQAQSKSEVLSKNIQARFNELQALIDRYLDDDAFTTYTETLKQKRAEQGEAAKAKPNAKANASRPTESAAAAPPAPARAPSPSVPVGGNAKPAPGPPQSKAAATKRTAPSPGAPPF